MFVKVPYDPASVAAEAGSTVFKSIIRQGKYSTVGRRCQRFDREMAVVLSKETVIQSFMKHFWLALPAVYFFFVSGFLNQIHDLKVLVPPAAAQQNFIYFTSDIFDVFWLIIAAIPNALFAGAYFLKIRRTAKDPARIILIVTIFIIIAVVWHEPISRATTSFSSHDNVWSNNLPHRTLRLYKIFELVSICAIATEAISTIFYIFCRFIKGQEETQSAVTLPTYALIASITMFLYWVMLILSNISNMKISNGTVGDPNLFPEEYRLLGCLAILAVTICAYLFWTVASKTSSIEKSTVTGIIGSIVFPGIAIVLQLIQILH